MVAQIAGPAKLHPGYLAGVHNGGQVEAKSVNTVSGNGLEQRSILARICFTILWFLPLVFIINMVVGGIVGGFAGTNTATFQGGYDAGSRAARDFFRHYGHVILGGETVIWLGLAYFGFLPGTGKFKRKKM